MDEIIKHPGIKIVNHAEAKLWIEYSRHAAAVFASQGVIVAGIGRVVARRLNIKGVLKALCAVRGAGRNFPAGQQQTAGGA